jgi:hypothetical protein
LPLEDVYPTEPIDFDQNKPGKVCVYQKLYVS